MFALCNFKFDTMNSKLFNSATESFFGTVFLEGIVSESIEDGFFSLFDFKQRSLEAHVKRVVILKSSWTSVSR